MVTLGYNLTDKDNVRMDTTRTVKKLTEGGRTRTDKIGVVAVTDIVFPTSKTQVCRRPGVHAPIKSVSVPAPISFFPPVKPRSAVHTDRQSRYRRLQGGQFRE